MYAYEDNSLNVLVVDDNEINAMILTKMLNMFHLYTDQAFSGKNAIKLSKKMPYDIIFIDNIMPVMNGLQVTKAIRKLEKGKRRSVIFILTSSSKKEIEAIYKDAGANEIFEKPLQADQLIVNLYKYFPGFPVDLPNAFAKTNRSKDDIWYKLRITLIGVHEINFNNWMKYAFGNHELFIDLLKSTLKEIQTFLTLYPKFDKPGEQEKIRSGIHILKSIFAYIGADGLQEEARGLEISLKQGNQTVMLTEFVNHLIVFKDHLNEALNKYKSMVQKEVPNKENEVITSHDYERRIKETIFHIKKYDYNSIIKSLEKLIRMGNNQHKEIFVKALQEIKEFEYENALACLMNLLDDILKENDL